MWYLLHVVSFACGIISKKKKSGGEKRKNVKYNFINKKNSGNTFFFLFLGFCILRASISYVYQWFVNFKVHIRRPMSENIQKIVFKALTLKMTKTLFFGGSFSIFTLSVAKMYFLGISDICQLVWILVDHCSAHEIFDSKMQKHKIESKNRVSCIFS